MRVLRGGCRIRGLMGCWFCCGGWRRFDRKILLNVIAKLGGYRQVPLNASFRHPSHASPRISGMGCIDVRDRSQVEALPASTYGELPTERTRSTCHLVRRVDRTEELTIDMSCIAMGGLRRIPWWSGSRLAEIYSQFMVVYHLSNADATHSVSHTILVIKATPAPQPPHRSHCAASR